jgi:hypothetical protein
MEKSFICEKLFAQIFKTEKLTPSLLAIKTNLS